jgi:hypothetical protein
MIKSRKLLFAALAIAALTSGCNGGVTGPMQSLNPGALIADFPDGSGYNSASAHVENQSSGFYIHSIQDVSGPADEITLTIPTPLNANVPYTVTASSDGAVVTYLESTTSRQFEANAAQGSCSITVTQVSPTVEGYFNATVICTSPSDSRVLSGGQFNATF